MILETTFKNEEQQDTPSCPQRQAFAYVQDCLCNPGADPCTVHTALWPLNPIPFSSPKPSLLYMFNESSKFQCDQDAVSSTTWENKDTHLYMIYWFWEIAAAVLGVMWGVLTLWGCMGVTRFCPTPVFSKYLQLHEEEYEAMVVHSKMQMTSFALFLVMCII